MTVTNARTEQFELYSPGSVKPVMGAEETSPKEEGRAGDGVAKYAGLLFASVMALLTWVTIIRNDPKSLGFFAFHPPLQTLAILLFTYGIMTLQPTAHPTTKAAGLTRHQLAIAVLGLPVIILGTSAVIHNKNLNETNHFKTWHGTFGIISMVWIVFQALLGGGSVWFKGAAFGGGVKAKSVWKYHRLSGYILVALLLFTCHLGGGWSNWGMRNTALAIRLLAYSISPVGIAVAIYMRVRPSKMKFF